MAYRRNYNPKVTGSGISIGQQRVARDSFSVATKQLNKDVKETIKTLNKLPKVLRKEVRKEILKKAAVPMVEAAKQNVPISTNEHFDYGATTNKGGEKDRTRYLPGNLKKSIRLIEFLKSWDIFLGPKIQKNPRAKTYGRNERNVNAYYAGFVEFGTAHSAPQPFMRPAFDATKLTVLSIIAREVEKEVNNYANRNKK